MQKPVMLSNNLATYLTTHYVHLADGTVFATTETNLDYSKVKGNQAITSEVALFSRCCLYIGICLLAASSISAYTPNPLCNSSLAFFLFLSKAWL